MEPIEVLPSALHALRATPTTVHWGYFDASLAPALRVKSGDLVQAEAITSHAGDDPDLMFDSAIETLFRDIPPADRPHAMIGRMIDKGSVWFAPMRDIAAHVRRCIAEGRWTPRIGPMIA
jgi:hypothetical protein